MGSFDDFDVLANLELLALFGDTGVGYVTTTLPVWDDIVMDVYNMLLTSGEVDAVLVDLDTSGAVNGTIDISGNNAAPGAPGVAAAASLTGKGWSVTTS